MRARVAEVAGVVTAHGLAEAGPGAPLHLTADEWEAAAGTLERQRLTGLAAVALVAGELELDGPSTDDLAHRDRRVQSLAVRAERATVELHDALDADGLPHRVLKGPAIAHVHYPDPASRPFTDVDVLVPPDAMDEVVRRCEAAGARRLVPELRPGFDRRFAKSVTLRTERGVELDVHRTLVLGPLGQLVALEDLWVAPEEVEVLPGRRLPVLGADAGFLHACLHVACGGPPRWLSLRDVVVTSRPADLARCAELAARWQARAAVRVAVGAVAERGLPVPRRLADWSAALPTTAEEEHIARAYRVERATPRALALASLRYVAGASAKAAYSWALAVPSAQNRRARGRTATAQLRRVLGRPA